MILTESVQKMHIQPIVSLPAKDWYMLLPDKDLPGIYELRDQDMDISIYIGEGILAGWRVAQELSGWSASELWYKCAPPAQHGAWFRLIERWTVSLLAIVEDEAARKKQEWQLINTHCPLLNHPNGESIKAVLERRYKYLVDTGIAGLYRDDAERKVFETQHPALFKINKKKRA
jgi:hypothetical protein